MAHLLEVKLKVLTHRMERFVMVKSCQFHGYFLGQEEPDLVALAEAEVAPLHDWGAE